MIIDVCMFNLSYNQLKITTQLYRINPCFVISKKNSEN